MRATRILALVGLMFSLVFVGGAGAKDSDRVVERPYGCALHERGLSCSNFVELKTRRAERFVTVRVVDNSGRPAPAIVGQDLDGDGRLDVERRFCEFTANFRIRGGVPVHVRVAGARVLPEDCDFSTNGVVRVGFRASAPIGRP